MFYVNVYLVLRFVCYNEDAGFVFCVWNVSCFMARVMYFFFV